MNAAPWGAYGAPVDPEQWRLAAEWLRCRVIHSGLDEVKAEADRIGIGFTPMLVIVEACADALHDAADSVNRGYTPEACCPERQRHNRAYQLRTRQQHKPS